MQMRSSYAIRLYQWLKRWEFRHGVEVSLNSVYTSALLGPAAAPYAKDIAELLKSNDYNVKRSAADALGNLEPAAAPVAKDIAELLKSEGSGANLKNSARGGNARHGGTDLGTGTFQGPSF
jgi:hypothetical protein